MQKKERIQLLKAVLNGDRMEVDRLTKVKPINISFTDFDKQRIALLDFGLSEEEVNEYMDKQPSHEEQMELILESTKKMQNE
jgi:hypothetical protein